MKKCPYAEQGKCCWATVEPHGFCGYKVDMFETDPCPELRFDAHVERAIEEIEFLKDLLTEERS